MNYCDITVGQKASLTKTFTDEDVRKFAEVSLDVNPLHLDDEYAKTTIFGKRIAHGVLTCGLISAVLANKLPGQGTIYLGQEVRFSAPVYLGDTITAACTVTEKRDDKKIIKLDTVCTNQDGKVVVSGVATVKHD
ncbi:MAG: MaoC family dehydratase [Christensenellales bacterium]